MVRCRTPPLALNGTEYHTGVLGQPTHPLAHHFVRQFLSRKFTGHDNGSFLAVKEAPAPALAGSPGWPPPHDQLERNYDIEHSYQVRSRSLHVHSF